MIEDLSPDVKKFLLTYNSIEQLASLTKSELTRINMQLEAEIAKKVWFSSTEFQTNTSWQWLQIWKRHWQPNMTQNCPWIHFEYTLSWANRWVQASMDIESHRIASKDAILNVAGYISRLLSEEKPKLLEGQGWLIKSALEEGRMFLLNRLTIDEDELSAEWIFNTGKDLFDQLSEIIPYVDRTVKELFSE